MAFCKSAALATLMVVAGVIRSSRRSRWRRTDRRLGLERPEGAGVRNECSQSRRNMGVDLSIPFGDGNLATGEGVHGSDCGSMSRIHGAMRRIIIIARFNKRGKIRKKGKMRDIFKQVENV